MTSRSWSISRDNMVFERVMDQEAVGQTQLKVLIELDDPLPHRGDKSCYNCFSPPSEIRV